MNPQQPQQPQPQPQQQQPAPTAPPPSPAPTHPSQKTNGMAIAAIICAFVIPILGFILALVALSQIKKTGEGGKGLAIASIIISIAVTIIVGALLLILGLATVASVQKNATSSTNSNSSTSSTNVSQYSSDEQKAVQSAEAFLNDIKNGDYNAAYNQMGPELKKQYANATEFVNQAKDKNLNLIKDWSITNVTTSSDGSQITVKGTLKANGANSSGTFEFGFYKDTDGSINMLSYELSPS